MQTTPQHHCVAPYRDRPDELIDVAPLAEAMGHSIFNSRDLYGLPRKFNIAFDNGGAISVLADTNDIGLVAVRVAEGKSSSRRNLFSCAAVRHHRP